MFAGGSNFAVSDWLVNVGCIQAVHYNKVEASLLLADERLFVF